MLQQIVGLAINYYREASTPLIQHVYGAFESGSYVTPNTLYTVSSNLNTSGSANPRQSFDSQLGRLLLHHTLLNMHQWGSRDMPQVTSV